MFQKEIEISGTQIPQTSLGTAPFNREPHFGHRAVLYELDLFNKPENILKTIEKSYQLGVKSIQLIPSTPVIKAIQMAQEKGIKLEILGTVGENYQEDIKLLQTLNTKIYLIDEKITDTHNWKLITKINQKIKETGGITGLITARPFQTTKKLQTSPILDQFDLYMIPINKISYMMDGEFFFTEQRENFKKLITSLNKKIIASRVLATGIQKPQEAFQFIKTLDYIDLICVGVAYEKEAEETWKILFQD